MKSKKGLTAPVVLLEAADLAHTNTTTALLDTRNFGAAEILLAIGALTGVDGSNYVTPKLQECDTTVGTSFTDVAAADIDGAFTAVNATTKDSVIQRVAYIGGKRYIRVVLTYTGSGITAGIIGCYGILGRPSVAPIAAQSAVSAT